MSIIYSGKFYLYRHIRLDKNEVFYVGISRKSNRVKNFVSIYSEYHRAYSKSRSAYWNNIINISKYKVEILLESDNFEFIKRKEIEFIRLYGRKDLKTGTLVNLTDGGEGMLNINRNILQNLSRKGCKISEESKHKLSIALKGRKITWGDKITIANTGRKLSEETKKKIKIFQNSIKKFGKDNRFSRKVNQIDRKTNELIKTWDCAHDVKKSWNLKSNHISLCCKGKIYYCYGYKWEYA